MSQPVDKETAIARLKTAFPDATHIDAANAGNKFELLIVDDSFAGKRTVARQQAVYAVFNDLIQTGAIHALTIHALTASEYQGDE